MNPVAALRELMATLHAWRNQQGGISRTCLVCDSVTGAMVGYVALCAAQIEQGRPPRSAQRNRPDPRPVILLSQLAVDRGYTARGMPRRWC